MAIHRLPMLLLLLLLAVGSRSAFIEPKGDLIADTKGLEFSMSRTFKLFGNEFQPSQKHYMTRGTGRIMFGTTSDLTLFDPAKRRENHMLQPLEITKLTNADSIVTVTSLYSGELSSPQLANLSELVRKNFWGLGDFAATGGRIFTWERQYRPSTGPFTARNDFQAALITNGEATFAIYNYVNVSYTVNDDTNQMLAGFSRAASYESASLPFSGTEASRLDEVSGVGSSEEARGRFVYRVDSWPPVRGGCLTADPTSDANRVLSTSVTEDSVLGGSVAVVSGRCHPEGAGQMGTCSIAFNGKQVGSSPANGCDACGESFLLCAVPASLREGQGSLTLTLSAARASSPYSRQFQFVAPDKAVGSRITLTNKEHWMQLEPEQLQLTFGAENLNGTVTLKIFGYSEEGLTELDKDESRASLVKELFSVALEDKTGSLNLRTLGVKCSQEADCKKYHLGFISIEDLSTPKKLIRSEIVPLGWFVHEFYKNAGQPEWFNEQCKAWAETGDEPTKQIRQQLKSLTCPCTRQLALSDASRFLPVSYCPHLVGGCGSATPEQSCFVSAAAAASSQAAVPAALCCYDNTNSHLLRQQLAGKDAAATSQGSRSFRSHPDGVPTAETLLPGQVSFMSHWYWDTLKQLYCCRWSSAGYCPYFFMQARPTPGCSAFKLGRSSSSVGDPHLTSFNNQKFLFNGYGEFWLVRTDTMKVQGRFLAEAEKKFSLLKAVGIQVGSGAAFEVEFTSSGVNVQRRLNEQTTAVNLVNGESYRDGGVTMRRVESSQLIVVLQSGADSIGVDLHVVADKAFANLHVSLSDALKAKTRGLLGRWTDNEADGFVAADGSTVVAFDTNMTAWNWKFCELHRLASVADSLFNYEGAASRNVGFDQVNNVDKELYMKRVTFESGPANPNEASVCGDSEDCKFDLRVTSDSALAASTKTVEETFAKWRSDNYTVGFCDMPDVAGIAISATDSLAESTVLQLRCAEPLTTARSSGSVTCQRQSDNTLSWSPNPQLECALPTGSDPQSANVGLIIGIVAGCLALIVIVIIVIFFVRRNRDDSPPPPNHSGGAPAGGSSSSRQPQTECAYQAIPGREQPAHLGGPEVAPVASSRRSKPRQPQQQQPRMNTADVVIDADHHQQQPQQPQQYQQQQQQQPMPHQQPPHRRSKRGEPEPSAEMDSARDQRFSYQQSQQQPLGPNGDNNYYHDNAEPQKVSRSEVV